MLYVNFLLEILRMIDDLLQAMSLALKLIFKYSSIK